MISFRDYLAELKIEIPKADETLGIERENMPQIEGKDYEHFLSYLRKKGASSKREKVAARTLKPIQKEFSKAGVEKSLERLRSPEVDPRPPVIVSKDNYIIDGHHRWLAAKNAGVKDFEITRVNAPMSELLKMAHDYPRVTYKQLGSNKVIKK